MWGFFIYQIFDTASLNSSEHPDFSRKGHRFENAFPYIDSGEAVLKFVVRITLNNAVFNACIINKKQL